jgi:hypothetical protein
MRSAGNFHPEWGYLAPAPSFMRTARIVLVAMAIGATAGAAVIISLVQRPAVDAADTSIAAHALVTSVPVVDEPPVAAAPTDEPAVAQSPTPPASKPAAVATASPAPATSPSVSNAASAIKASSISPPSAHASGSVATLSDPPASAMANTESASVATSDGPDPSVKPAKKERTAAQPALKRHHSRPFQPLFSLFSGPRRSF